MGIRNKKRKVKTVEIIYIYSKRITRIIKKKDDRLAEIPEEVLIKSLRIIFYGVLADFGMGYTIYFAASDMESKLLKELSGKVSMSRKCVWKLPMKDRETEKREHNCFGAGTGVYPEEIDRYMMRH